MENGMRSYWIWLFIILLVAFALSGCSSTPESQSPPSARTLQPPTARDLRIVTGQIVYVPAYSEVFYGRAGLSMELAVTLAIHNTDLNTPIIIQSVRYYDTDGNLVRDYISEPVEVSPLATTGFLVEGAESSGGWGANFIVEWGAEQPVYEPVIEAIMVSTRGTQGISIISLGRVISQTVPDSTPTPEAGSG
jgi:hypothetical protein